MTARERLPIGIMRLLAAGALAEGMSIDEYIALVLTEHAETIRTSEARAERLAMRLEQEAEWKQAMMRRAG